MRPTSPATLPVANIAAVADAPVGLVQGRKIAASLSSGDCRAEVRDTCTCKAQRIVFIGRPDGEHSLCLGSSSKARILAHWQGYAGIEAPVAEVVS